MTFRPTLKYLCKHNKLFAWDCEKCKPECLMCLTKTLGHELVGGRCVTCRSAQPARVIAHLALLQALHKSLQALQKSREAIAASQARIGRTLEQLVKSRVSD